MSIFNNTITPTNEELKSKYGFIYVTVNNINNKIYVGQKKFNSSWKSYLGSGVSLNHSIKKYGKENFTRHIIEICHEEEIDNQEIHWIYELNAMDKNIGYNLCEGGRTTRGFKYSDEQKEVNRIRRLELWKDPEYRKKMSKSLSESWTDERREQCNKNIQCFKDNKIIWEGKIGKQKILELGFDSAHVYACCRGERKTHKGHTFKYKE